MLRYPPSSPPPPLQVVKTGLLLGRSELTRFQRAFDKADLLRDGELTVAEAARAYRGLGGEATKAEVIYSANNKSIDFQQSFKFNHSNTVETVLMLLQKYTSMSYYWYK